MSYQKKDQRKTKKIIVYLSNKNRLRAFQRVSKKEKKIKRKN